MKTLEKTKENKKENSLSRVELFNIRGGNMAHLPVKDEELD